MAKVVEVTELILRDAHQSLMATRMALEDMAPACTDIDARRIARWNVGAELRSMPAFAS